MFSQVAEAAERAKEEGRVYSKSGVCKLLGISDSGLYAYMNWMEPESAKLRQAGDRGEDPGDPR